MQGISMWQSLQPSPFRSKVATSMRSTEQLHFVGTRLFPPVPDVHVLRKLIAMLYLGASDVPYTFFLCLPLSLSTNRPLTAAFRLSFWPHHIVMLYIRSASVCRRVWVLRFSAPAGESASLQERNKAAHYPAAGAGAACSLLCVAIGVNCAALARYVLSSNRRRTTRATATAAACFSPAFKFF